MPPQTGITADFGAVCLFLPRAVIFLTQQNRKFNRFTVLAAGGYAAVMRLGDTPRKGKSYSEAARRAAGGVGAVKPVKQAVKLFSGYTAAFIDRFYNNSFFPGLYRQLYIRPGGRLLNRIVCQHRNQLTDGVFIAEIGYSGRYVKL